MFKLEQSIRSNVVKMLEAITNEDNAFSPQNACHALMMVCSYLSWAVYNKHDGPDRLIEAKDVLVNCCNALLERGDAVDPQLRVQACISLADCQQLLSSNLPEVSPCTLLQVGS